MSKRRGWLHPLMMAAVASLNDKREAVDKAAAASDIECGSSGSGTSDTDLDDLILLGPRR